LVHRHRAAESGVNPSRPEPDSLGRAGFSTLAMAVLSVAIGLGSSVAISRSLGPTGKGGYDLAVASAALTVMIIGFPHPSGVTMAVARGVGSPIPLLITLLRLAVGQAALAWVLLSIVSATPLGAAVLPMDRSPLVLAAIAALVGATSALGYARSVLTGLQQFVAANWRDLLGRTATVGLLLAAVVLGVRFNHEASPWPLLVATVAGTILTAVFMIQGMARLRLEREGPTGLRDVVGYSRPMYLGNLVQFLNYRLDVFLVAAFAGLRELGLYTLAVTIGQLLLIVSNAAAGVLFPRVAAASPDIAAREAARLTRTALLAGIVGAVGLALVATPLIGIVYGQAFAGSVPPLLALLPGIVALMAASVLASYIAGLGKLRINLIISVIGLCVTVPLDVLLIPRFGAVGAAIASSASYTLSAVITVRWAMKLGGLSARDLLVAKPADFASGRNALRRFIR
jgi:O-antigen/teichoic acid export membrane protein